MCWTVRGDEDSVQSLDEMCMGINELAEQGAAIEVTFMTPSLMKKDAPEDEDARDDFAMLSSAPRPAAIMQVQRDLLVQDVVNPMERHFDASGTWWRGVEVDKLFAQRFDAPGRVHWKSASHRVVWRAGGSGHGGGRRPRHLH